MLRVTSCTCAFRVGAYVTTHFTSVLKSVRCPDATSNDCLQASSFLWWQAVWTTKIAPPVILLLFVTVAIEERHRGTEVNVWFDAHHVLSLWFTSLCVPLDEVLDDGIAARFPDAGLEVGFERGVQIQLRSERGRDYDLAVRASYRGANPFACSDDAMGWAGGIIYAPFLIVPQAFSEQVGSSGGFLQKASCVD